jgi:exopolyphosphatase/guanosine-5'-triphosphate,3'-diphosphate pyrophosphatase
LYDLVGRLTDEDARVRSVRAMQGRYHVDASQAERVENTARDFLKQTHGDWELGEPLAELLLSWAARLHEVGLDVSHSHYQKHGAYLLEHADLPGFPQDEQKILACLVGAHRRKMHLAALEDLNPPWHQKTEFLIVILRLAVLLHRGRSVAAMPAIQLRAKGRMLEIFFPKGWLEDHPLTAADLEFEIEQLKAANFRLRVA